MHCFIVISSFFSILILCSCKTSSTDFAIKWTKDIKERIVKDANQVSDKSSFDSSRYDLTFYKGDTKLKFFHLKPTFDIIGKIVFFDTAVSIFYSADQNFELIRELCPVSDRSFEGIKFKGNALGLAEFRYCDGKIKKRGFRFDGNIGLWKEYDPMGKVIKETDNGNLDRLQKLKDIGY